MRVKQFEARKEPPSLDFTDGPAPHSAIFIFGISDALLLLMIKPEGIKAIFLDTKFQKS
jgi:hypothetical protein